MPTHVVAVRAGIHPRVVAPIYTRALDANNRGQIVGDYGTPPTGKPDPDARGSRTDSGRDPRWDMNGVLP